MNYKHGQRVKVTINGIDIDDAKISIVGDGRPYICQDIMDGEKTEDKLGYKYSWIIEKDFTHYSITNLRPAEKDWDSLEVGDVVVKGVDEREVLGICGRIIFISRNGNPNELLDGYTKEELKEADHTIKNSEPTPETITIAGHTYNKSEVESRLSGLKEIK